MSWIDEAHEAIRQLIAAGEPFSADDLLAIVGSPDDEHAANGRNSTIGAIFAQYSTAGQITVVGHRQSRSPRRKGGLIRVWQRAEASGPPTLFDAMPFHAPEHPTGKSKSRPVDLEVRLQPPWVLLSNARGPVAHLVAPDARPDPLGTWRSRCGRFGYRVRVEGTPMARGCHDCLALDRGRPAPRQQDPIRT